MSSSPIAQVEPDSARHTNSAHTRSSLALPFFLLAIGFLVRMVNAAYRFLNPDEALHYLLSIARSGAAAEHASLTTSHPPLLILFLHYWGLIGHSEWFLRLPHVLAGTAFCWIMFCWLRRVANYETALMGLVLWLFSPTMIQMSTEVRQYALLMFFSALSCFFLDVGIEEDSPGKLLLSALALYFALLVHYASLIIALTLGVYALARWAVARTRVSTALAWIAGQIGALAIVAFLFVHHVSKLRARGQPMEVAETYARRSIFWPGQESKLSFVGRNTIRLFHYFFNQEVVGILALVLFAAGVVLLIQKSQSAQDRRPRPWQLALLFMLPIVVDCITGLLQLYPYGGSRHDIYLAMFAIPGIAIPLAHWYSSRRWLKLAIVGVVLIVCNFFGKPLSEYIRFDDQNRTLMTRAVSALRSLPAGSRIFTDDQGGMLLSVYLCNTRVIQIEQEPPAPFFKERCGDDWVISLDPRLWIFRAETFPDTFQRMQQAYHLSSGTPLWFFQSGWYIERETELRDELKQYGCESPQNFGRNMFMCSIIATRAP